MANTDSVGSRCVALVGPYLSGKTTLLEAMLAATGAIKRKGAVKERNTIGDFSPIENTLKLLKQEASIDHTYLISKHEIVDAFISDDKISVLSNAFPSLSVTLAIVTASVIS